MFDDTNLEHELHEFETRISEFDELHELFDYTNFFTTVIEKANKEFISLIAVFQVGGRD